MALINNYYADCENLDERGRPEANTFISALEKVLEELPVRGNIGTVNVSSLREEISTILREYSLVRSRDPLVYCRVTKDDAHAGSFGHVPPREGCFTVVADAVVTMSTLITNLVIDKPIYIEETVMALPREINWQIARHGDERQGPSRLELHHCSDPEEEYNFHHIKEELRKYMQTLTPSSEKEFKEIHLPLLIKYAVDLREK